MKKLWRLLTSLRTAAALLAALAALLLLNVAIPQRTVIGEEAFSALAREGGVPRVLLVDLGLGSLATSPVFLLVIGLVFVCLVSVLVDRGGVTFRRVRFRPPSIETLQQRAANEAALSRELPEGWSAEAALGALKGLGYRRARVGGAAVWGVKHRLAPVGFVIFHLSFLLLLAGGVLLHMTRFVAVTAVAEGQTFAGEGVQVLRQPQWIGAPALEFTLEEADIAFERGEPVRLAAKLRILAPGALSLQEASINHPARVGATSVLVERAGLAPVLWLQDQRGFTLDRVAVVVPPSGSEPVRVELDDDRLVVEIAPVELRDAWPSRGELAETPVALVARSGDDEVLRTSLRAGQGARVGRGWLAVQEMRQWVGVRIVSERGSSLLVAGFAFGVVGLIWRLSWHRREMGIVWGEGRLVLTGRSEFFRRKFRAELDEAAQIVAAGKWERPHSGGGDDPTG